MPLTLTIHWVARFCRAKYGVGCSGNPSSVAAFYSPNGSLTIHAGAPAECREAIAKAAQGFMTTFSRPASGEGRPRAAGQSDRLPRDADGTNRGPGSRVPPVRIGAFEVWSIAQGRTHRGITRPFQRRRVPASAPAPAPRNVVRTPASNKILSGVENLSWLRPARKRRWLCH